MTSLQCLFTGPTMLYILKNENLARKTSWVRQLLVNMILTFGSICSISITDQLINFYHFPSPCLLSFTCFSTSVGSGKIEKIRVAPPVSPASSDSALPSPLSDLGSDDSGGSQRPKNFMQTLMEDYETHKVKRREKAEDNSVSFILNRKA